MLVRSIRHLFKKIKDITPQPWVIKPDDATKTFYQHDTSALNIQVYKEIKQNLSKHPAAIPQPLSPIQGPITVKNPKIHDKIYRWCSCGQSLKQPFCDGSHEGTSFKPFLFTIQEKVKDVQLCGCKLTSKKPFCDGEGCNKNVELNDKKSEK